MFNLEDLLAKHELVRALRDYDAASAAWVRSVGDPTVEKWYLDARDVLSDLLQGDDAGAAIERFRRALVDELEHRTGAARGDEIMVMDYAIGIVRSFKRPEG
jgi:hypothetical protein